ncbi:hypothetical protein [Bacillus sp. JCM 19034]|uniref:hypothetical protein n=1 Tax=Bacillus sp. JCM 19034 TaxID=1481928 RepID=UPI000A845F81
MSAFTKEVEIASQLGCRSCVTYILPSTDFQAAAFMAKVIRRLRTCAVILNQYDMKLGLNLLGHIIFGLHGNTLLFGQPLIQWN